MAILHGVSKSRFPDFTDPNNGIGQFLDRAISAGESFLKRTDELFRNSFVEDGVEPAPGYSFFSPSFSNLKQVTKRRVYSQRARATIFIKKRLFSTLKNNFDIRFMDQEERLFLRAAKALFKRKCDEIAFYENLISLEGIKEKQGFLNIDDFLDNYIEYFFNLLELGFVGSDTTSIMSSVFGTLRTDPTIDTLLRLRERNLRSKPNKFTTWIVDSHNYDFAGLGPGVGVIELNLVSSFNSSITNRTGSQGQCTINIEDPYRLTMITESDIEIAVRSATSATSSMEQVLNQMSSLNYARATQLDEELNALRAIKNRSPINFEYSRDGSPYPIGIVVETGEIFNAFTIDSISDNQKFEPIEKTRAVQILDLLMFYKQSLLSAARLYKNINEDLAPVRKRMRKEFLGHSIIQHMDGVSIFVNSNTRDETPAYTGMPTETQEILRNRRDTLSLKAIQEEWEILSRDTSNTASFSFEIYKMFRNPSFWRTDGVAVFTGLVSDINSTYTAESGFSLSITAKDNTEYLKISRFTSNPSMLRPEGILEDPLTPFDLQVSNASGLVTSTPQLSKENLDRLAYLRFDDGPFLGNKINNENQLLRNKSQQGNESIITMQHVPGLVYKWKEGIISATLNVNTNKPPDGGGSSINDLISTYGISVMSDPFAGLDTADIISILVTGQPYNYISFLKHSVDSGNYSTDPGSNSKFYFNYLFDFLNREKFVYGNFIPAKSSIVSQSDASSAYRLKQFTDRQIASLNLLQTKLAELQDRQRSLSGGSQADSPINKDIKDFQEQISNIKREIDSKLNNSNLPENIKLQILGNEVVLNVEEDANEYEKINRGLRYRLKKKPEDVRYNIDENFFVVSEEYDQDVDIQAIVRQLKDSPANLFSNQTSDYKAPYDQCRAVADTINFEFYADANGNIVFQPPQYNKTPLSLLVKMFKNTGADGTSMLPDFLKELFSSEPQYAGSSRIGVVKKEIHVKELRIMEKIFLSGGSYTGGQFGISYVLNSDYNIDESLLFSEAERANAASFAQSLFATNLNYPFVDVEKVIIEIIKIRKKIGEEEGNIKFKNLDPENLKDVDDVALEVAKCSNQDKNQNANLLALKNSILALISQRQYLLKLYSRLLSTERELVEMTTTSRGQLGQRDLNESVLSRASSLFGNSSDLPLIPKAMRKLVENDYTNDDGWASGKRFIINDDVVMQSNLNVQAPQFCRIDVTGQTDFIGGQVESSIPGYFWAGATDFDLWRQFGYRGTQAITRPDFSNAETQCAPYAVFKLLEQRAMLHSGSITIMGNEFYKPGDVVFVNHKGLLYYVTAVSQNFNFTSGSLSTTLTLSYGRPLGEYIPTPLDIIGKTVLNQNRNIFGNIKNYRTGVPASQHVVPIDTLFFAKYREFASSSDPVQGLNIINDFKNNKDNKNKILNIINSCLSRINLVDPESSSRVEIRVYYINKEGQDVDYEDASRQIGNLVRSMLITGLETNGGFIKSIPEKFIDGVYAINIANEIIEQDKIFRRFPSAKAWAGAVTSDIKEPPRARITPSDVSIGGTPLPLNAIDIVFVQDQNKRGDRLPPQDAERKKAGECN